uniref:Uncharacterized protein n=1 Tax=Pinctada fucata TaxID=50426 RepID=A0A194AP89_PINFU
MKMKAKMIALMVLSICVMIGGIPLNEESCESSYDCSGDAPCCVDVYGNVIGSTEGGPSHNSGPQSTGTCKSYIGEEYDVCDDKCKCRTGFECYREMSGVQQPEKCRNATWVQEQKEYWANCIPTCIYPP